MREGGLLQNIFVLKFPKILLEFFRTFESDRMREGGLLQFVRIGVADDVSQRALRIRPNAGGRIRTSEGTKPRDF